MWRSEERVNLLEYRATGLVAEGVLGQGVPLGALSQGRPVVAPGHMLTSHDLGTLAQVNRAFHSLVDDEQRVAALAKEIIQQYPKLEPSVLLCQTGNDLQALRVIYDFTYHLIPHDGWLEFLKSKDDSRPCPSCLQMDPHTLTTFPKLTGLVGLRYLYMRGCKSLIDQPDVAGLNANLHVFLSK